MFDFLRQLFNTSDFPPRWDCGNWSPAHGWLHIISDLGVWSAYVAIPVVLGYFVLRRRDIPFRRIFWLFAAFILACGTTHLMEAIIFWWPAYRLAGMIKLCTAIISWGTVIALVPVTPRVLAMRSPIELEREISARQDAESALKQANAKLERQIQALSASEERFRLLVDGSKDHAIFMLDPTGRVVSWNLGAERLTQYRADEIIGQSFWRFFSAHDVEAGKPQEELRAAASEGRYEDEGWRVRKDGSRFWANVVITALRDENGNLRGFSKITRDMTERKQAEEYTRRLIQEEAARRAAEEHAAAVWDERERLRVTLHSIADAVIATDVETRITLLNPVAESLTGWCSALAVGKPLDEVFHIIDMATRKQAENPVASALREGTIVAQSSHRLLVSRDQLERPIDDRAAPIKNEHGGIVGAVLVFRDVTEKRAAESALRTSEERLRLALEAGKMGVWEWNLLTNAVWWSDHLEQIHGLEPGTFGGTFEAFQKLIHIDDRELVNQAIRHAIDTRSEYDIEFRIARPDGSIHWMTGKGKLFCDEGGRPLRMMGVGTDVTDRKRVEQELREADHRKNEFLATLAHELRNPLAPLRSGLQILGMTDDLTAQNQAREMMERQVAQMVRLIDDLLDIGRISCNKLELRKARISLTSVIESAVETARPLIDAKRHTLFLSLPAGTVDLDADLTRLAQVFSNILNNAAKYTDPGGRIELIAQADGPELVVKVRDTGIGIPSQALAGLFTMFSQVEHSLERSQGGLGIGLALVRGLVEMHGGTVSACSEGVGQGSEFVVRLPIARENGERTNPQSVETTPAAPRRRVLIVDDNRDGAASLEVLLSLLGHDSRTAHDGLEALHVAESFRPDLMLLDIGLPKLNGYDVCRRVRQQPWGKDVFMVAVTGWGQQDDRRRSAEAGFDQHVVKPLDTQALRRLLAGLATESSC